MAGTATPVGVPATGIEPSHHLVAENDFNPRGLALIDE
jgi:hypothetical protein